MTDEWNSLADLLANLIEKYISDLKIDDLPDPITDSSEDFSKLTLANAEVA